MNIVNLTQHQATEDQILAGVVDLSGSDQVIIKSLLTFTTIPSISVIHERAEKIAEFTKGFGYALIGGAPYLMSALEQAILRKFKEPLYSFTARVSEETTNPDGTVTKTNVFKHVGFVQTH